MQTFEEVQVKNEVEIKRYDLTTEEKLAFRQFENSVLKLKLEVQALEPFKKLTEAEIKLHENLKALATKYITNPEGWMIDMENLFFHKA